jgi:hypothetical protein
MAAPPTQATNPLALMSQSAIVKQATNSINKAYAPGYANLDKQGKTASDLSAKRTADNKYFMGWLDTQNQALQAHADAANAALSAASNNILSQPIGTAGNVGTGADATAVAGNAAGLHQQLAGANLAQNASAAIGSNAVAATGANNTNVVMTGEQKQQAALDTTLLGISTQRTKLQSTQGSDIVKEIARLQGVNVSIAQSNRAYDAAAQKLGISAANTQSLINTRQQTANTGSANAATNASRAGNAQMNSDRTYNLDLAKFGAATAKDIYQRTNGLGPYKPAASASGQKPLTQTSQNAIYNKISTIQGQLRQLVANGSNGGSAFQTLKNGGSGPPVDTGQDKALNSYGGVTGGTTFDTPAEQAKDRKGLTQPINEINRTKTYAPADLQLLNVAYDSLYGAGVSKGDVAALQARGLANPGSRLKLSGK